MKSKLSRASIRLKSHNGERRRGGLRAPAFLLIPTFHISVTSASYHSGIHLWVAYRDASRLLPAPAPASGRAYPNGLLPMAQIFSLIMLGTVRERRKH